MCACVCYALGMGVCRGVGVWAGGEKSNGSDSHRVTGLGLRSASAWSARRSLTIVPSERGAVGGDGDGIPSSWVAGVLAGVADWVSGDSMAASPPPDYRAPFR